jgi:hypothetical protein
MLTKGKHLGIKISESAKIKSWTDQLQNGNRGESMTGNSVCITAQIFHRFGPSWVTEKQISGLQYRFRDKSVRFDLKGRELAIVAPKELSDEIQEALHGDENIESYQIQFVDVERRRNFLVKHSGGEFAVLAETAHEAAQAMRSHYPNSQILRISGDADKSGMYAAYAHGNPANKISPAFRVVEA